MPSNPSGPVRRAQLIAPFGVGSLINMPGGTSVIVAGLDFWFKSNTSGISCDLSEFQVEEWRLQSLLQVDHFRLPPDFRPYQKNQKIPNANITIPTFRFPSWYFCPDKNCRLLKDYPMTVKGRIECPECKKKGKKRFLYQVPFITMCEKGHLQDFPWSEWVHHDPQTKCQQKLKLVSTGSATLAGQRVICECGKERTLAGITTANPNGSTYLSSNLSEGSDYLCQGHKPWLGPDVQELCNTPLRGSLRSASNLYFANVISSLYLPRIEDQALQKLEEIISSKTFSENIKWAVDLGLKDAQEISRKLKAKFPQHLEEYKEEQIQKVITKVFSDLLNEDLDQNDVSKAEDLGERGEATLRREEHRVLLGSRDDLDLKIELGNLAQYDQEIVKFFSKINLVKKLRETKVLASFTRVLPESQLDYLQRQDILWNKRQIENHWLPAYVVYGEGIFFEFDENKLREWETRNNVPEKRLQPLVKNYEAIKEKRKLRDREISPRFVLLHTFAHLVMNRLTYECGYSSAALRERLYVSTNPSISKAGILIYTADGDSEGTMGGLVRMGNPGNLEPVIRRALENAKWCSSDPVCMEMGDLKGQGPDSCNLAACHNCALVPETACEEFNRFLDRGLVIGTFDNPDLGFFDY